MGVEELPQSSPLKTANYSKAIKLPFISFDHLPEWFNHEYEPTKYYETTTFGEKHLDLNCFITRIESDEMAPLFTQDTFLIVKKQKNIQKDDIILILNTFNKILVRKYLMLNGERYLISSNPKHEIINFDNSLKLLGIVIEGRILI